MRIPDYCKCLWCNGTMVRRGATRIGFGINTFSLWCQNCGAIVIHAKDSSKTIDSFEITFSFQEESKK